MSATAEEEEPEQEHDAKRCAGHPKERWHENATFEMFAVFFDRGFHGSS
jgi:hypothetical protein